MLEQERLVAISTPLGDDELILRKAEIHEELGKPFSIDVELLSDNDDIALDDLLGQNVTLRLETQEDSRYFNGIITEFFQKENIDKNSCYGAIIRPWFWLLTLSENCRIFQDVSYPDIIKSVFDELGFSDYENKLTSSYSVQDYVVQYNESDFNFVSRIMEQEGIYFYFIHANGKHILVLVDDSSVLPECGEIPYFDKEETSYHNELEGITVWKSFRKLRTGGVSLTDYDFTMPSKSLDSITLDPKTSSLSALKKFKYPGKYSEKAKGTDYTKILMEKENALYDVKTCAGNHRSLFAGAQFDLVDHHREDQNSKYLITAFSCTLKSDHFIATTTTTEEPELYTCKYTAIPANAIYRPQVSAIKPKITGPQTAMVVGKSGEEIWTDKYGRVKVLFHWDRYGEADEKSSCWIRVSQNWAGKGWGTMQIPRIGQEVLVDFLHGDPDKPIIIGSVYNGSTMPPYKLPENATISGMKSRSSKGGAGFNEFRVEDKKGEEQIFIHAERNQDIRVKNNQYEWIGNELHIHVEKNRFELIKENDNYLVEGDALTGVTGDVHNQYEANVNQQTAGDENYTIGGNRNQAIEGSESLKAGSSIKLEAGSKYGVKSGQDIDIKAGMNLNLEAGMSISIKAGASFIAIGPGGIDISGPMVKINSGGSASSANPSSPSSPESPDAAEKALEADNASAPGKADSPKGKNVESEKIKIKPVKATEYSPRAKVMQQAAESGTPFCEECEKAKK
ncbi:type VI secretion system Vgr family protein [Colwellia sp. E150_009]